MAEILFTPSASRFNSGEFWKDKIPCSYKGEALKDLPIKPVPQTMENWIGEDNLYSIIEKYLGHDFNCFNHNSLVKSIGLENFLILLSGLPVERLMFECYDDGSCNVIVPISYVNEYKSWIKGGAK